MILCEAGAQLCTEHACNSRTAPDSGTIGRMQLGKRQPTVAKKSSEIHKTNPVQSTFWRWHVAPKARARTIRSADPAVSAAPRTSAQIKKNEMMCEDQGPRPQEEDK